MSKIKILPSNISNRIAAGEVVERPASVVRELIENAIDAGASRIIIEVLDGGRKQIRVTDNGYGMARDDLELSVERHATSKIASEEDLDAITTMGFRGEALASIGSVANLEIISKPANQTEAWQVSVRFSKKEPARPAAFGQIGTRISVEDLFLDIPARRKFLKTKSTEFAYVAATIRLYSASSSDIHFELYSEGELVFKSVTCPLSSPLCLSPLIGEEKAARLFSFNRTQVGFSIVGHLSQPEDSQRTIKNLYFFLNKRPIKSPVLQRAVLDAYKERLTRDNFPVGGIFLEISPDSVDVNVHPAKLEVKFERPDEIFRLIYHAVRIALDQQTKSITQVEQTQCSDSQDVFCPINPSCLSGLSGVSGDQNINTSQDYHIKLPQNWQNSPLVISENRLPWEKTTEKNNHTKDFFSDKETGSLSNSEIKTPTNHHGNFRVIGQVKASFILIEHEDGIIIMDQHAAHEAFLYKMLCKRYEGMEEAPSQPLLFPLIIELNPSDSDNIEQKTRILRRFGFQIDEFGENQLIVRAIPAFLDEQTQTIKKIVEDVMQDLGHCHLEDVNNKFPEQIRLVIASIACHGAIKMNRPLDHAEMEELARLIQTENLTNCPHGRPIFTSLTFKDLEKRLGRH